MSNKAYVCALRTIRRLQTCHSAVGSRIPILKRRDYASSASLLNGLAHNINALRLGGTSSGTNVAFRYLSQDTPVSTDEKDVKSYLVNKDLTDLPESLDRGSTALLKAKPYPNNANPLEDDETFEAQYEPLPVKEYSQHQDFEALQKCTSPSDVLELCGSPSLSLKFVSNCFTTMWETSKKIGTEQRRYENQLMMEHPNFGNLCRIAMQGAPRMNCNDLVYTLHSIVKLQIYQRSRLVQTLLRASQERLSKFEEREMSVLASTLDGMESCRNVDALRSGLSLLVEMRIPNIRRVHPLQSLMRSVGKDAPNSLKKKLETKALQMVDQFTLPNAQYMFNTLAAMKLRSIPLLDICSQKIIDNIDGLPFWKLIHVLQSCRELSYRNEQLLTALGDHILATLYMWQTKQIVLLFSMLENLTFRHVALLDRFAETVIKSPESLTLKDLAMSAKTYSLMNHLPEGRRQEFLDALYSSLQLYLPRIPPVELLRIVYCFCILDYFPQEPLDHLLKEEVLQELLTSANQNVEINERMLHSIKLCLELDNPSNTKLQEMTLGQASTANISTHPEVQETLQSIVGDPSFFRQNTQLPNDYFIDFELCLDTAQNQVIPVDDTYLSNITRVALLCVPISAFCVGTLHPVGKLAMKMRHLRALGYEVVLVPVHEFTKLDEPQREEFLRSLIFSRESSGDQDVGMDNARE